jgi:hypothetical protein
MSHDSLTQWHNQFGGRYWRVTYEGVETKDAGLLRTRGEPVTVQKLWDDFGDSIYHAVKELGCPADMVVAMIPIEAIRLSTGHYDPKSLRLEPGYISDEKTPHRVSPGLMQTLISTAKGMARKYRLVPEESVDRDLLLDAHYSILLGSAYIQHQIDRYAPDPPIICGAYNAGSLRRTNRHSWRILTYGETRLDRYIMWFNDFLFAVDSGLITLPDDCILTRDIIGIKNESNSPSA